MDIFRSTRYEISDEFGKDLTVFMGGMKRQEVREHVLRGKVLDEGEKPMTFQVYKPFVWSTVQECGCGRYILPFF